MTNNDMQVIIGFYKKFDRYKENTNEDLYQHVLPSFQLKQYKIHKDGENVIAFTNWAFLNKEAENRYVKTAELNPEDWNSGNQPWHIDTLCIGNILKVHRWTKKYFTDLLGANKTVSWLRVLANGKIKRQTKTLTKKIWDQ
jgi:hemolysin-activating ACP:hemolysin acyltransferase|tara:strand:- start:545 stop:967 length:423 start_codon:yes stop_codon:yes gene_type:complete